ncbi:MAG: hypothetical protein P1V97_23080, partial [Planctomycetota bacterium]|nr:hypothetical protein [Planctomycetota bacterium]
KEIEEQEKALKPKVLGLTDNLGEFHLKKIPKADSLPNLVLHPNDAHLQKKSLLVPRAGPDGVHDFGTVVLEVSGALELIVSSPSKTLRGVTVQLLSVGQYQGLLKSPDSADGLSLLNLVVEHRLTGAEVGGATQISNLSMGQYYVIAYQRGFFHSIPKKITIGARKGEVLRLELRKAKTVVLEVRDKEGNAIVGATAHWGSDLALDHHTESEK